MAEQTGTPVPLTREEFEIIKQIVRSRPGNARVSPERLQDLIVAESIRVMEARDQARASTPSGPQFVFQQFAKGAKPTERILTQEEALKIAAKVKAEAPEGLTTPELINLTEQAVHQARMEGLPPTAFQRTLKMIEPFITPNLPENPVEMLPGHLQQAYRRNQLRQIQEVEANAPAWLAGPAKAMLERDRPYPPTPGDLIPILDPYNLVRMGSDAVSLVTGLGPIKKAGKALGLWGAAPEAKGAMSQMPTPAELKEAMGGRVSGPGGGLKDPTIIYRPPERPARPDVPWESGPEDLRRAAEEAEAAARAQDVPWRTGPDDLRQAAEAATPQAVPWESGPDDLRRAAEDAEAAVRSRDVPWGSTPEDLRRAAEEATPPLTETEQAIEGFAGTAPDTARTLAGAEETVPATLPLREAPASTGGPLEAPGGGAEGGLGIGAEMEERLARASADPSLRVALQNVLEDFDARRISREEAHSTVASLLGMVEETGGAAPETVVGLRAAPEAAEGAEEVIKTRTRPGSPHAHTTRVAGFNAPGERLPLISQAEADRIAANIKSMEQRRGRRGPVEGQARWMGEVQNDLTPEQWATLEEKYPFLGEEAVRRELGLQPRPRSRPPFVRGLRSERSGGETGMGTTRALSTLFGTGAGALTGAAAAEEGREGEGAVLGGIVGGGLGYQIPREAELFAKQGAVDYYDKLRRGAFLAGWAVPKSVAGSVGGVTNALAEQTFYGHPIEATKNLIRGLQSIPKGYEEAKGVVQSGHAPAYALLHPEHAPPAEGIASIPGRTMGIADAFARNAIMNMVNPLTGQNYTADEAAAYLLSGQGKTKPARGFLDFMAGRTGNENVDLAGKTFRHLEVPVGGGTSVNAVESGVQRLPVMDVGGVPLPLNFLTEAAARKVPGLEGLKQTNREVLGNMVLGTGAYQAGQSAEEQMDPESARARQMLQAFFGKYGVSFALGMAKKRNEELNEARRATAPDVVLETIKQEGPLKGPRFNARAWDDYTSPWRNLGNLFAPE